MNSENSLDSKALISFNNVLFKTEKEKVKELQRFPGTSNTYRQNRICNYCNFSRIKYEQMICVLSII